MNKAERHRIKMVWYKRRLNNLRLPKNGVHFHVYRTTGKPCSCAMCSPGKEKANGIKKKAYKEFQFELQQSA